MSGMAMNKPIEGFPELHELERHCGLVSEALRALRSEVATMRFATGGTAPEPTSPIGRMMLAHHQSLRNFCASLMAERQSALEARLLTLKLRGLLCGLLDVGAPPPEAVTSLKGELRGMRAAFLADRSGGMECVSPHVSGFLSGAGLAALQGQLPRDAVDDMQANSGAGEGIGIVRSSAVDSTLPCEDRLHSLGWDRVTSRLESDRRFLTEVLTHLPRTSHLESCCIAVISAAFALAGAAREQSVIFRARSILLESLGDPELDRHLPLLLPEYNDLSAHAWAPPVQAQGPSKPSQRPCRTTTAVNAEANPSCLEEE